MTSGLVARRPFVSSKLESLELLHLQVEIDDGCRKIGIGVMMALHGIHGRAVSLVGLKESRVLDVSAAQDEIHWTFWKFLERRQVMVAKHQRLNLSPYGAAPRTNDNGSGGPMALVH
jgi:hypothetical protein